MTIKKLKYPIITCRDGGPEGCGHWSQIIWQDTTRVGCGVARCPGRMFEWEVHCFYNPAGNVYFNGQPLPAINN